jgi:hypothetical protein
MGTALNGDATIDFCHTNDQGTVTRPRAKSSWYESEVDRSRILKVLQIGESVPIDSGDADAEDKTRRPDRLARGSIL